MFLEMDEKSLTQERMKKETQKWREEDELDECVYLQENYVPLSSLIVIRSTVDT